jgi:uncharacterized cupredoxin-like copper-binding protein
VFAIILVAAALLAAACGGSSGGGSSSGGSSGGGSSASSGTGSSTPAAGQVTLSEFKIAPATITASSGGTLTVQNTGTVAHDLVIADSGGKVLVKTNVIQPGASAQLQLPSTVTAGSYSAFCDIPGHKSQGMVGTLTVS